ncbi:MFS transporter [Streptomyces sp. NBC_01283]|uniref:MFS transporter n=1 Tax=Streptomyces sp. NBC_01283 TaxID=2903812 RepID=UPI00352DE264|nr:MFS transporter [Streptomyces sp. NBC_01283]WSL21374.1 MFS transporter [Streptomyces sp. NBC_01283]
MSRERAAPPGGWTIYAVRFLTYSTWGVLYPFFTVWLLDQDSFSTADCGLITGAAVLANRLGSLAFVRVLPPGSERASIIGSQLVMAAAAGLMCAMALLPVGSLIAWMLVSGIFGLAGSLATLAQLTLIVHQFGPEETRRAFSYENVALNAAGGLAPFVSSLAYAATGRYYVLAPIGFAVLAGLLATRLATGRVPVRETPGKAPDPAVLPRGMGALLGVNFLTHITYAQFYGVFAAYASPSLGARSVGLLFAFASVAIVVTQALVTRLCREAREPALIVGANLALGAGTILLVAPQGGMALMLLAVLAITIGEMLYGPVYQTLAVAVAGGRTSLAVGALTFVWGLAESLAVAAGLWLIGAGLGAATFLIGGGAALAVVVIVAVMHRSFAAMANTPVPVPAARRTADSTS